METRMGKQFQNRFPPNSWEGKGYSPIIPSVDERVIETACLNLCRERNPMIKTLPRKPRRSKAKKSGGSDVYGASYSRSTVQYPSETSIAEQQREIALKANRDCVIIPDDNRFVDTGVSGTARHRGGLNALLVAARFARLRVLYLHDLTRLSRDLTMLISIIDELVLEHGVRVVSIQDGFDTNKPGWGRHAALLRPRHD